MRLIVTCISLITILATAATAATLQPRQITPGQKQIQISPAALGQLPIVRPGQRIYNLTQADIQEGQLWTLTINGPAGSAGSVQISHPWNMLPVKVNGDYTPDGKAFPREKPQYQFALRIYTPDPAPASPGVAPPPQVPTTYPDHHLLPIGKPGKVIIDIDWQGAPLAVTLRNWNTGRIITPASSTAGLN